MSKKYTADILDSTIENGYGRINLGQWGVGIGSVTSPRADIETSSDAILKNGVWINNNSSVYFADTVNNYGTSYAYIWGNGNAGTSFLAFDTNAGRAMTIDNSRNVGIGTTSIGAGYKLQVKRDTNVNIGFGLQNGGASLEAVNDAINANIPLSLYGSKILMLNGNVGIGTTSPSDKMHIYSAGNGKGLTIEATSGNYESAVLKLYPKSPTSNERNWAISAYRDAADDLSFSSSNAKGGDPYSSGTTRMLIEGITGNVGIGTTSPNKTLSVNGEIFQKSRLNLQRGSNGATTLIQFLNEIGSDRAHIDFGGTDEELSFFAGDGTTNHLHIKADGKVGIGTTVPSSKLHVNSSSGDADFILQSPSQTLRIDQNSIRTTTDSVLGLFVNNDSKKGLRILTSGYVGVGTTSPTQRLDVNGKIRATDDLILAQTNPRIDYDGGNTGYLRFLATSTGNVTMALTSGGNVGIGTTSPSGKLHIVGSTSIIYNEATGLNQNSSIWFKSNVGGTVANRWEIGTNISSGADFEFYSRQDSGSRLIIKQGNGNVGIGTTSPSAKLEVVGSIKSKTVEYNWYQVPTISSTNAYTHIKTNLYMGAGNNTMHIMGGFTFKGYKYALNGYGEGSVMFHNWSGNFYNLSVTNRGDWSTFVRSPYTSADGYCVLVIEHNDYARALVDLYQFFTPYGWRTITVSAYGTSNNLSGVY